MSLAVTTGLLFFVWPKRDTPAPSDAIVVLNGGGNRQAKGVQLAERGLAPMLVFSEADPPLEPDCRLKITGVKVICFRPDPASTQGESEAIARLAGNYRWHRILLVVSRPQATRARLRLRRCYSGQFLVQTVPVRLSELLWTVIYEGGATIKALVWQRDC